MRTCTSRFFRVSAVASAPLWHIKWTTNQRLQPLLRERCFSCHGSLNKKEIYDSCGAGIRKGESTAPTVCRDRQPKACLLLLVCRSDEADAHAAPKGRRSRKCSLKVLRRWNRTVLATIPAMKAGMPILARTGVRPQTGPLFHPSGRFGDCALCFLGF